MAAPGRLPLFERNYNSGGAVADVTLADARTVTVRLFHDAHHRSALFVPFAASDSAESGIH